ncbi:MAG: LemA family protein [Endomicrobia bacterium]|nr:LemA family protein [Endomicrobiia bacterium]
MSIVLTASVFVIAIVSILMLVALIIFIIGIYNSLISLKVNIDRASSNIDVLAKQRFDEIPNLVEICKAYMKHERETLQKVIEARTLFLSSSNSHEIVKADLCLGSALKSLYAVSEQYPDLKANEQFLNLQRRVTALENDIAGRREFYNASVALFNTRIYQIPDIIVARYLNLKERQMFQTETKEELRPVKTVIRY